MKRLSAVPFVLTVLTLAVMPTMAAVCSDNNGLFSPYGCTSAPSCLGKSPQDECSATRGHSGTCVAYKGPLLTPCCKCADGPEATKSVWPRSIDDQDRLVRVDIQTGQVEVIAQLQSPLGDTDLDRYRGVLLATSHQEIPNNFSDILHVNANTGEELCRTEISYQGGAVKATGLSHTASGDFYVSFTTNANGPADQLGRLDPVTGLITDVEDFSGLAADLRGLGSDVDGWLFSCDDTAAVTSDLYELGDAPPFGYTLMGQYGDVDGPVDMDDVAAHGLSMLGSDGLALHELDSASYQLLQTITLTSPDDVGINGITGFIPADSFFDIYIPPSAEESTSTTVTWDPITTAATYDVIHGDLGLLRQTTGNYKQAITGCAANDTTDTTVTVLDGDPAPGNAFFYLVKPAPCGTYDNGADGLMQGRDASIGSSTDSCADAN